MTRINGIAPKGLALCVALGWMSSGCGRDSGDGAGGRGQAETSRGGTAPGAAADSVGGIALLQLSAVSNQLTRAQSEQSALVQGLMARIESLEKRDADRTAALKGVQSSSDEQIRLRDEQIKIHAEREQKLAGQIAELQSRVEALRSGRVLPEITVASDGAPTTRELDQKIRISERKAELAAEAADARAKEAPRLSVGAGGVSFSSADTNFTLKLKGLVQLDSRVFLSDNRLSEGNDSFVLRRVRPILEGTLYRDFDYQFVPDFGGSSVQIFDANINYRFRQELQLKAGKFKGPVGFENLQSDATLPFNERSFVASLVPSRSVGVQLGGDALDGALSYAGGIYNLGGDGRNPSTSDFGDDKELAGRVSALPFKQSRLAALQGFGFGVAGSYSQVSSNANGLPATSGGARPGYTTAGAQQFFAYNPANGTVVADGVQWRFSPYATYLYGPFGLLGEYGISHQSVLNNFSQLRDGLEHRAWQLSAQWVLTGEAASFTGINPSRPFKPSSGGWGAWQLVGRFGQLDIDDGTFPRFGNVATSASEATAWSVGVNWWLNKNVRLLTSFSRTTFKGGGTVNPSDASTLTPPGSVTTQDENAVLTRLQLGF